MLTRQEAFVLDLLSSAWNKWVLLDDRDPRDDSDFMQAIHSAQRIVGTRVARRVDPDVWSRTDA